MKAAMEQLVWERAGAACEYCQMPHGLTVLPFQIDHIIAEQHDGPTESENLALLCLLCNLHKGPNIASIDRDSGALVPLFNPRRDRTLRGLTPVGRITVRILVAINIEARVVVRASLIDEGAFPPSG